MGSSAFMRPSVERSMVSQTQRAVGPLFMTNYIDAFSSATESLEFLEVLRSQTKPLLSPTTFCTSCHPVYYVPHSL